MASCIRVVALAFVVLSYCALRPASAGPIDGVIKRRLEKLTARELPGMAILVARDGVILFQGGFGFADLVNKNRVSVETKFRTGSLTKQFTAAAILRLVDDERLALTDTVGKFFPGFPRGSEITLHQLLTHTSGLSNFTKWPDFYERVARPIAPEKLIAEFAEHPLDFAPGTGSRYSNSGYFLLGRIVEQVVGKSLDVFLRENFFDPLGMRDTGMLANESLPPGLAIGYSVVRGKAVPARHWDMGWTGGAGGLYSTVGDLHRWNEALFGGKVVTARSFAFMTTPVRLPPENVGYGYGLIMASMHGLQAVGHRGEQDGWSSDLYRLTGQNCTVVVLGNAHPAKLPSGTTADVAYDIVGEVLER